MEDEVLWHAFVEATLDARDWTHRAHLRVAWMHLRRYPLDEAHLRMRVGIIRLNAIHGLVETPERGYHETLTRAWLVLVAAAMQGSTHQDSLGFLQENAERLGTDAPLRHYSRPRLFSVEARARFLEPDLAALP